MIRYWIAGLLLALSLRAGAQTCVASTPVQPVIAPEKCAEGYVLLYQPNNVVECFDAQVRREDVAGIQGEDVGGKHINTVHRRDSRGNLLSVYKIDEYTGHKTEQIAEFGAYDTYGRPGYYIEGEGDVVALEWPSGGACLPSAMTARGWTSKLTWADAEHVSIIDTPYQSGHATYAFNYYPDGGLHMQTAELPISNARLQTTRAFDEDGGQSGGSYKFLPAEPTTSAALAPGATPPDPFFQPKVIVRPVPGAPLGPRLLGPLSLLYPVVDFLGHQIGRFLASAEPHTPLTDACGDQLIGDYGRCEHAVDAKYGSRPWPPNGQAEKAACDRSARERHAYCLREETMAGAPDLALPPPATSATRQQCENNAWRDYLNEIATCAGMFPMGGVQLTLCEDDAHKRFEARMAACVGK